MYRNLRMVKAKRSLDNLLNLFQKTVTGGLPYDVLQNKNLEKVYS